VSNFYVSSSVGALRQPGQPNKRFSYFSIDGGATQICQWGQTSDSSDFRNGFPFANDLFNENVGTLGQLTTADIQCMEALGFKT